MYVDAMTIWLECLTCCLLFIFASSTKDSVQSFSKKTKNNNILVSFIILSQFQYRPLHFAPRHYSHILLPGYPSLTNQACAVILLNAALKQLLRHRVPACIWLYPEPPDRDCPQRSVCLQRQPFTATNLSFFTSDSAKHYTSKKDLVWCFKSGLTAWSYSKKLVQLINEKWKLTAIEQILPAEKTPTR